MRASDADRSATARVVQDAVTRGLLTPDEGSERLAAAFAAVHRKDLGRLTADLPPATSRPAAPGWRLLAMMAVEQLRATWSGALAGRPRSVRIAVAVLLAVLLIVAVGSWASELFEHGGHGRFDRD
jgi:hypothetical protein